MRFNFKLAESVAVLISGAIFLAGCAKSSDSIPSSNPTERKAIQCDEIQEKVLAFDGQDRSKLIRSVMTLSLEMSAESVFRLEDCLTKNLQINCDSRSCLIREKYFVSDIKK